jgi:hypothetical protein
VFVVVRRQKEKDDWSTQLHVLPDCINIPTISHLFSINLPSLSRAFPTGNFYRLLLAFIDLPSISINLPSNFHQTPINSHHHHHHHHSAFPERSSKTLLALIDLPSTFHQLPKRLVNVSSKILAAIKMEKSSCYKPLKTDKA